MSSYIGKKIDITGADVCVNQMFENALYLYPYIDYLVGSEDNEWGEGWSYWYFLQKLVDVNGNLTPEELAGFIVEAYANGDDNYCGGNNNVSNPNCTGSTQSALDLNDTEKIEGFLHRFSVFSAYYYHNGYKDQFDSAYSNSQKFYYYMDLIDYIDNLNSVVSNFSLPAINANGITIYFPDPINYDPYYNENKLAKETFWDSFVNQVYVYQNYYATSDYTDYDLNGIVDKGETFNYTVYVHNVSNFKLDTVTVTISQIGDFCNYSPQTYILSDILVDKYGQISFEAVANSDYVGLGSERFNINIITDYFGYDRNFTTHLKIGDATILLVDDDNGDTTDEIIVSSLNDNYLNYTIYQIKENGNTFPNTLLDNYSIVIWNTGRKEGYDLFKNGEIQLIEYFLDKSGNLLFSSQNFLATVPPTSSDTYTIFLQNYLGISGYEKETFKLEKSLFGLFADPITEGLNIDVQDNNTISIWDTEPMGNAIQLFKDDLDRHIGIRNPRYSKSTNFKTVFCPFPMDKAKKSQLNIFIAKTIEWFLYGQERKFDKKKILAYPNPATKEVRFTELDDQNTINIYNISGNLVRTLPKGTHIWYLKNQDGEEITNGIYIYVVEKSADNILYTGKIAVVK